jgi:hypothetical protein
MMSDRERLAFVQFASLLYPGFTTRYETAQKAEQAWKKYKRSRGLTSQSFDVKLAVQ